jgi:hypothetical protein
MAPSQSMPAYVKNIRDLAPVANRVPEQIIGRLLNVYIEHLKAGKDKAVAYLVDKGQQHPLKSVLVMEAWNPVDKTHMMQKLKPLIGKVISVTNSRITSKGKSMVYFDISLKCAWDAKTNVSEAEENSDYPDVLPTMTDIKFVTSVKTACMISLEVAVTEAGDTIERTMPEGGKKLVANVKVATGNKEMAAAFWEGMGDVMGKAPVGSCYRLEWMILKPDGPGKYALTSISSSSVHLLEGSEANAISSNLAEPGSMQGMSQVYGKTRIDKMKDPVSRGVLLSLEILHRLGLGSPGVIMIAGFMLWKSEA